MSSTAFTVTGLPSSFISGNNLKCNFLVLSMSSARRTWDISNGSVKKDSDFIFVLVEHRKDLDRLKSLQGSIRMNGAIWVVTPRGKPQIKQTDVITATREADLVDRKVVRFSETHTALKLVIPLNRRPNNEDKSSG